MTKHIFRVPVDSQHFKDTIEAGKPYTEVLPFLPAADQLKMIAKEGRVRYWGSLPGQSNRRTFKLLTEGDELLCYRSGKYGIHGEKRKRRRRGNWCISSVK